MSNKAQPRIHRFNFTAVCDPETLSPMGDQYYTLLFTDEEEEQKFPTLRHTSASFIDHVVSIGNAMCNDPNFTHAHKSVQREALALLWSGVSSMLGMYDIIEHQRIEVNQFLRIRKQLQFTLGFYALLVVVIVLIALLT